MVILSVNYFYARNKQTKPTGAYLNAILNSHEQKKRTLQRYFNFLTSARAFKC